MNSATSKVRFADGAVTYNDFRIVREEGIGSGNFTYDFAKHEVRVSDIKSTLRPDEAAFWIDPDLWKRVVPYKFRQPPTVTANGIYQFAGGKNTRLEINVDALAGMHYVFLGKTLSFDRIAGRLLFTNDRLQISDLHGSIFSGSVRGSADISLAHGDPRYRASIVTNAVDFPHLTDLYYNYKTAHGQLSGSYDFTGFGSEARRMQGSGKLTVTNGVVHAKTDPSKWLSYADIIGGRYFDQKLKWNGKTASALGVEVTVPLNEIAPNRRKRFQRPH